MVYKRLFWNVLIRVTLIAINATGLGLALVFLSLDDLFTISIIAVALLIQSIWFVSSYNRINRDLSLFFAAINSLDSSISFRDSIVKKQFSGLYNNLMNVNSLLGELKFNLEEQNQYFKSITNQAPSPIISYYDDGRIGLINAAAMKLFGVSSIRNVKELYQINGELTSILMKHQISDQLVLKTKIRNETMSLMLKMTSANIRRERIKIASIQNIEPELGLQEIESWQKLLKVLTHEIANSIGPISSTIETLTETVSNDLNTENYELNESSIKAVDKIRTGLTIMGERSQGLLKLLADIRRFSAFPPPAFSKISILKLFETSIKFFEEELTREGIKVRYETIDPSLEIWVDEHLITHVLINLITNAREAMAENSEKELRLGSSFNDAGAISLRIIDNGPGIDTKTIEQIFVPFYTSKETGSGIGLSLSKEIMRLHRGDISVVSQPGQTEFILKFNPREMLNQ